MDAAVERALQLVSLQDTLIIVTADHAHPLSIASYAGRGNPILGEYPGGGDHRIRCRVERVLQLVSLQDTLIIVTADHAHPLSIASYAGRGNPILGEYPGGGDYCIGCCRGASTTAWQSTGHTDHSDSGPCPPTQYTQNRILVKVGQNWSNLVKKRCWSQCLK